MFSQNGTSNTTEMSKFFLIKFTMPLAKLAQAITTQPTRLFHTLSVTVPIIDFDTQTTGSFILLLL